MLRVPPGLRRGQQPARRGAARRGAGGARHRVRAGLSGQCRRRDRLPPGGDRRPARPRCWRRSSASGTSPADVLRARPPPARRRSRSPTGSCATASAPKPERNRRWPPAAKRSSGCSKATGSTRCSAFPGVHTVELYRGLPATGIRHITPRHEQGAGFMADGYARVSGKPGVCFIITGPGMTNILTAMGQAYGDFDPDAGDLQRQPHRSARHGPGAAARAALAAGGGRGRRRLQPHLAAPWPTARGAGARLRAVRGRAAATGAHRDPDRRDHRPRRRTGAGTPPPARAPGASARGDRPRGGAPARRRDGR